jgi:hypothetical protein
MNWRLWLYGKLIGTPSLTAIVPTQSVFAAGSITAPPMSRPFVIYRIQGDRPRLDDNARPLATSRSAEIWAYDDPGSYDRIESYLKEVRALAGQVIDPLGIACEWQGESGELADDELKCITKFASLQLTGRE